MTRHSVLFSSASLTTSRETRALSSCLLSSAGRPHLQLRGSKRQIQALVLHLTAHVSLALHMGKELQPLLRQAKPHTKYCAASLREASLPAGKLSRQIHAWPLPFRDLTGRNLLPSLAWRLAARCWHLPCGIWLPCGSSSLSNCSS